MEEIILQIIAKLRAGREVDDRELVRITHATLRRAASEGRAHDKRAVAKRRLLLFYQQVKRDDPDRWRSWDITPGLEERLLSVLRMKPRRTASGVATITVITKPWPCSGSCLFCPNDVRMPKSYLHGEPACERAEQNWFDPYLQVASRLTALSQMGHATDKVELIVLGGTWSDYPRGYQIWFMRELFRALNEGARVDAPDASGEAGEDGCAAGPLPDAVSGGVSQRRAFYRAAGFPACEERLVAFTGDAQRDVDAGRATYNAAIRSLYGGDPAWREASRLQVAGFEDLEREQRANEVARHRVVGLVIETRPDAVTPEALTLIRHMGCTKVQMGVQSLDQRILDANGRGVDVAQIRCAFELLRAFGFKIHAHAMANLYGSDPESDKEDYRRLVRGEAFQPDEIKLYPCALIDSSRLRALYEDGRWQPYAEDELLDILADDVLVTPPFCRISRMIRDFSSNDIMAGNKKPNLRQLVEARLRASGRDPSSVGEIRFREVGTGSVDVSDLALREVAYATTNTDERFLQWVASDGRIAGFCRLSMPRASYVRAHAAELPVSEGDAMIREVHVYGAAARLGEDGRVAQHLGLGRALVERACKIAAEAGYHGVNVISAVGTREYYRRLGFEDDGLYQRRSL